MEISTSCAHCGLALHILVDERLKFRVQERGADPRLFVPQIDWERFRAPNIVGDY